MSSTVVSTWQMVSVAIPSAASPTKTRSTLGVSSSMLPAPHPTAVTVMVGMAPAERASVVRIAAPVGVTSSRLTPVSTTGNPFSNSAVAGPGTGMRP